MSKMLLVVDMQEGFRYPTCEEIIDNVKEVCSKFEIVVFSKFMNEKNSNFEKFLGWKKFQNENDRKIMKEFEDIKKEVIAHKGYGVLNNTFKEFILNKNITKVYLCGIYSDVSIIKCAMDLFDLGVECFLYEDACSSRHSTIVHKSAIESIRTIIGKERVLKL